MLVCACVVTIARLASPFEIGIDQAVQLEAAQRLVHGQGLTSTYFGSHPLDLSQPTIAERLTWFPPGFSLLMAGFFAAGLPLLTSLKIVYGVTTLVGWWGWAVLLQRLLTASRQPFPPSQWSITAVAVLSPIFLTPSWTGTDPLLWAATPYVVMLLVGSERMSPQPAAVAIIGLLVGALCWFRYAAVFLVPASVLILWQVNGSNRARFVRHAAMFCLAALLGIAPMAVNRPAESTQGPAGYVESMVETDHVPLREVAEQELPAIGMGLIGSPILQKASEKLAMAPVGAALGLLCMVGTFLLPFAARSAVPSGTPLSRNLALSLSFLQLCLTLFLVALTVTRPYNSPSFLIFTRYFLPVSVASLLVWALLAGRSARDPALTTIARAVVVLLVVYYCGYLPVSALVRHDAVDLSRAVLGSTPPRSSRYQSTSVAIPPVGNALYSVKEATRRTVASLHREYPDAVFFIQNYHYFVYGWGGAGDPVPGIHLRRFLLPQSGVRHGDPVKVPGGVMRSGLEFWKTAYAGRPLRVIWVLNDPDAVDFIPESNRRWISDDPYEGTTILMSEFPRGKLMPGSTTAHMAARWGTVEEGRIP